ncbi:MAG: N,N-diacetyllegionaminate synthase [Eubacteriales bacterium]|nr:N,N-diacetyllegionaminate synthase [Eubacteriales bacterium]MDN5363716.1 N,N-diacetyllegionaminate synthase [Eubacteriales bacterium]
MRKRVKIVAEIGVNHNGSLEMALKMVEAAWRCGADAVKVQVFRAEELATREAEAAFYQKRNLPGTENQQEMLRRLELTREDLEKLKAFCDRVGLEFIATPFDLPSLRLVAELGVAAVKISSGDLTALPFLRKVRETGKDVILSTGMATLGEVEEALEVFRGYPGRITLLHCTSDYPARAEDVNLLAMVTLAHAFALPVGYSDHTQGWEVAVAAVALGAEMIEKHFTLDKTLPGPDHRASADPEEFSALVAAVRKIEVALGDGRKRYTEREEEVRRLVRKSVVAARDIRAGEVIGEEDLALRRPGTGLHPRYLDYFVGKRAVRDIKQDEQLHFSMVEG